MKSVLYEKFWYVLTFLFGIPLLVLGETNQIPLRNDFVGTNPSLFQSNSLKEKRVILVIDSYLLNYRLTKSLYNSVGGNLAPDQVSFEIGHPLASEISNMCKNLFGSVKEVPDFKRARGGVRGEY